MRTSSEQVARDKGLIPTAGELVQAILRARAGKEQYVCINTLTGGFCVLDHQPFLPHVEVRVNVNIWERNHRHDCPNAARLATKLAKVLYEFIALEEVRHGSPVCR